MDWTQAISHRLQSIPNFKELEMNYVNEQKKITEELWNYNNNSKNETNGHKNIPPPETNVSKKNAIQRHRFIARIFDVVVFDDESLGTDVTQLHMSHSLFLSLNSEFDCVT